MAHSHDHSELKHQSDARLIWAIIVNVLLTVAQAVGGILAGSLSLVADALHNLSDAVSLALAFVARRIARKPPDKLRTFGYGRAEIIGALINVTTLVLIALYLIYEAIFRFFEEPVIDGWIIVIVAGIALIVDVITAVLTYSMSKKNLNMKAAFFHNVSDALASVGVIIAGTLIILYKWHIADLIVTLIISSYILWQSISMLKPTIRILMDSAPPDVPYDDVISLMESIEGVHEIHHLHIRHINEHDNAIEAHVVVDHADLNEIEAIKRSLKNCLHDRFQVEHTTLEIELLTSDDTQNCNNHPKNCQSNDTSA